LDDKLPEAHTALAFLLCLNDFDMAGLRAMFQGLVLLRLCGGSASEWKIKRAVTFSFLVDPSRSQFPIIGLSLQRPFKAFLSRPAFPSKNSKTNCRARCEWLPPTFKV
jgi:hypothetical protein